MASSFFSSNDVPFILQSASSLGQEDAYPTKSPVFLRDTESQAKVVLLHRVADEVVVIQSVDDEQELIVGANGGCYFESPLLGIREEFKVDVLANGSMVFVSCRTGNALDCDDNGLPRCIDTIRRGWFLLQREVTAIPMKSPIEETAPVPSPVCGHCKDHDAKERREYTMKLVSLGKSLDEIDSILLRMYAWPTAERIFVAGQGAAVVKNKEPVRPKAPWQWMKTE
ncbi:MutS protein 1 [Phytophthora ramorum]